MLIMIIKNADPKIKILLFLVNDASALVMIDFSVCFKPISFSDESKFIKQGKSKKVTTNETINPSVIIQPNAIIGLIKRTLTVHDYDKFKRTIANAKLLTERKRYYVSNYGIENYIDIVNGKTDKIVKAPNYDRYYDNELIEWWRKLATKRFDKLNSDGRLRNDLEVWTKDSNIDIIRWMRITIYKRYNEYISHDFPPQELDNIKQTCYSMGIKWYTISYTETEMIEYERLFKRHN